MKIVVLVAGNVGGNIALVWAKRDHEIVTGGNRF